MMMMMIIIIISIISVIVILAVVCRVWSLKTGELVNTLQHHSEAVLHLRFADGIMVTCSKVYSSSLYSTFSALQFYEHTLQYNTIKHLYSTQWQVVV